MALMTHAHTGDYNALTRLQQDKFDQVMADADNAADNDNYRALMRIAALIADIALPASGEIRKCGCSCYCGAIFDATDPGAHVIEHGDGYNLGRHQCPQCADRHRETA